MEIDREIELEIEKIEQLKKIARHRLSVDFKQGFELIVNFLFNL
jgi:hypothetical protein